MSFDPVAIREELMLHMKHLKGVYEEYINLYGTGNKVVANEMIFVRDEIRMWHRIEEAMSINEILEDANDGATS